MKITAGSWRMLSTQEKLYILRKISHFPHLLEAK